MEQGEGVCGADFAEGGTGFGGAEASGLEQGEFRGRGCGGEGEREGEEGVEEEEFADVHYSAKPCAYWISDCEGGQKKAMTETCWAVCPNMRLTTTDFRKRSTDT